MRACGVSVWNPEGGSGFRLGISRKRKAGPTVNSRVFFLCSICFGFLLLLPSRADGQTPDSSVQIAAALQAAPAAQREEATVLGFDRTGAHTTLRSGSNDLVCLADDPADNRFSVACYHASLEPYMARGRALRTEGISDGNERNQIRWREAEEGKLSMPEAPATLYVMTGSSFDAESGEVVDSYLRYVIYVPWATVESTGLTDSPQSPGSPWLMFPGTAGAHIMISPPQASSGS